MSGRQDQKGKRLLEPERLGKYELTKFLGGGMSRVYLARDTMIGRTVAVKILKTEAQSDEETRDRFIREAKLAGGVNHENIIRVYDFGEESGQLFMVMEYLEGEDLNDAIKGGRGGSMEQRLRISLQVARAMQHIHTLQMVHRDLKPHNVYLTVGGVAKLMDFGIAKTNDSSITRTGFAVGTPVYMAPEQVRGENATARTDVYAFGMFLFEVLTGTKPWVEENIERIFWQVLNGPVNLDAVRQHGVPEWAVDLIRRCSEKDPALRPANFDEVIQVFEAGMGGGVTTATRMQAAPTEIMAAMPTMISPSPARTTSSPTRPPAVAAPIGPVPAQKPKWLFPAIGGAVVVLALIGYLVLRPGEPAPKQDTSAATQEPAKPAGPPPVLSLPSGDMVLIEAGPFLFGENNERRETGAYYIDKTEVTNAAYSLFVKETQSLAPKGLAEADPMKPVVNVTIADARAFASWAGKRLPDELEWEKAARGTDGRPYPWGADDDPSQARVGSNGLRAPVTTGSPTPYGAVEMTGNAWEWVDQGETPSAEALRSAARGLAPKPTAAEPWRQARGGSFAFPLVKAFEKLVIPERFRADDIGFRCVRDVPVTAR